MTSDNLVTAPVGTDLETAGNPSWTAMKKNCWFEENNGRLSGLITIKDIEKGSVLNAAKDEFIVSLVAELRWADIRYLWTAEALEASTNAIVIDTAHGHSTGVLRKLRKFGLISQTGPLIVGNIATAGRSPCLYDGRSTLSRLIVQEPAVPMDCRCRCSRYSHLRCVKE